MAVTLTINGVSFQYPEVGDEDYGQVATAWATAATNLLAQFASSSLPIADSGQVRLGNLDTIEWRNAADDDNVSIYVDTDDRLYYKNASNPPIDLSAVANGNVTGPLTSTDNALARYDGALGQTIQNSLVIVDDSGNIDTPADITIGATNIQLSLALVPIGTIVPHYDFNDAVTRPALPYWAPCDGGTYTIGGVSRVTPDLSGRYMVGFGTDGGGDNQSAPWSATPVGNSNHQINIAHTHTVDGHTHSISSDGAHTHTVNGHTHSNGTLVAELAYSSSDSRVDANETTATSWTSDHRIAGSGDGGNAGGSFTTGVNVQGATASASPGTDSQGAHTHTGSTGSATPATDSQLSSTQSIQPKSILVRWYMRAA